MVFGQNLKILTSAKKDIIGKGISRGAEWCKFQLPIAPSSEELQTRKDNYLTKMQYYIIIVQCFRTKGFSSQIILLYTPPHPHIPHTLTSPHPHILTPSQTHRAGVNGERVTVLPAAVLITQPQLKVVPGVAIHSHLQYIASEVLSTVINSAISPDSLV